MTEVLILALELFALSRLSLVLVQSIGRTVGVRLTILFLFPGTVIHELSHLFVAEVMGVPTGKLTLVPEGLEDGEVRAGSVAITRTDPFRRTIIGIAPVVVGMGAIAGIAYMTNMNDKTYMIQAIQYYLLFAISNSMFSSREDLKGIFPFVATLGILLAAGFLVGFRFSLTGQAEVLVLRILESLTKSLGLVLAVNGVILLTLKVLLAVTKH